MNNKIIIDTVRTYIWLYRTTNNNVWLINAININKFLTNRLLNDLKFDGTKEKKKIA